MRAAAGLTLLLAMFVAACSPQAMADKTARSMARDVVAPVIASQVPAASQLQAADCVVNAAQMPEVRALARDYGVTAGTLTRDNIRSLALRPAAQSCFAANGIPSVR